jgi:hypothetical protein
MIETAKLYQTTKMNTVLSVSFFGVSGTESPKVTAQITDMELERPVEACDI